MEIKTDVNFYGLEDMVWSGAVDTLKTIKEAGKEDELMQLLEEVFMDKTPTDTEVNDFLWFETSFIYERLGLNEDGEEKTALDIAREENTTWGAAMEGLELMEKSGLFEADFLTYLKESIENMTSGVYYFDVDELDSNSNNIITSDHVEWLNDNL